MTRLMDPGGKPPDKGKRHLVLEIEELSKTFHLHILGRKMIETLKNVSLHVSAGEFLGISGPSGVGKSTLLKCIYRTYLSSGGQIWYASPRWGLIDLAQAGHQLVLEVRQTEIGYVSQFLQVLPRVAAIDIVAEPLLQKNGLALGEARKKAAAILEKLHIPSNLFEAYPVTFSGGEQQRINLARAVIWKPRLLLLDEPTASLDKDSIGTVIGILKDLKEQGTTLLGIFHQNDLMTPIIDRIFRLSQEN